MDRKSYTYLWAALLLVLLGACANMAQGPTGGKADVIAPTCLGSTPKNGALNVKDKRVEIVFDEFLQLNDPTKNLVVSPPQKVNPSAKAVGKKIVVELRDSLLPNETYTFDFGNSIGDYTENNSVSNFQYSFSTGDHLDSLTISGVVLNAEDLSPVEGVMVGIYSDEADSSFSTKPFERVGRTAADGKFVIRGVASKQYRVFALEDLNNNFFFDQAMEGVAPQESPIAIPSLVTEQKIDTIYGDSMKIDTIITREIRKYAPNDIVLRLYHEKINYQEFKKIERGSRNKFVLTFEKMESSLPSISLVDTVANDWYLVEANKMADTITYWITDSSLYKRDTISLSVSYLKTDSMGVLTPRTDTIMAELTPSFLKKEAKDIQQMEAKRKKAEKRSAKLHRTNILKFEDFATVEIDNLPCLVWENPLSSFDEKKVHLYRTSDSTRSPLPFSIEKDTARGICRRYFLKSPEFHPDSSFTVSVDSACAYDFYGNHNDSLGAQFKILGENLYSKLTLSLENVTGPAFVELLNQKSGVVRTCPVKGNTFVLDHLKPGTYFLRMVFDANGNGVWDTGKYREGIFPEQVAFFPKGVKLRANWEVSEDWDVTAKSILEQRPSGLNSKKKTDNKKR